MYSSLVGRRWKDALDRAIADRPYPAERPFRRPVSSELALYQARGGGPAIPGRDSLSEVGPPCELTPYQARGRWAAWTLGWPTQHRISEGAKARSMAPTMPVGIQRRGHSRTISPESPCLLSGIRGGRASMPRRSPTTANNSGQTRPASVFHRRPLQNKQSNPTPHI